MKKTLAILLTLALVICMIPGMAFADEAWGNSYAFKSGYETEFVYNGVAQGPDLIVEKIAQGGTEAEVVPDTSYKLLNPDKSAFTKPVNPGTYTV
ncbi:MAG: hypothetical protein IKU09_04715, partial [Firmicutes bacterium]|nr:hypothetical protein [Bacillota bacterium]